MKTLKAFLWLSVVTTVATFTTERSYAQSYQLLLTPNLVQGLTVSCIDGSGQKVPGCTLTVTAVPYNNTNGHFHNTNRPVSLLAATATGPFMNATTQVITNAAGDAIVWMRTPKTGQAEQVTACAQFCDALNYGVGYPDIYWVEEKPQWIHVGGDTTGHGGNEFNHWMTSTAGWGIWNTAVAFLSNNPSQGQIAVNDMSLPFGGTFDVDQNWNNPHTFHRQGKSVDVRGNGGDKSVPVNQLEEFHMLCADKGAVEHAVHSAGTSNQHIHCRW